MASRSAAACILLKPCSSPTPYGWTQTALAARSVAASTKKIQQPDIQQAPTRKVLGAMGSAQNYFGFPGFFPRQKDNIFIINIDKYIDRPYSQTILQICQFFLRCTT
ncbi:hypothetical protein [Polaromonas sp. CG_9.11]|uniref:hypothetical protein n=1 Tax=Polaromonas sp. CG_9.11 TaxID=2787730 RepID=UPI0018C913CC|nr:hypothetical protein [Polaromonas sp. CG_9.11]MBG6074752.1 hypothetical protein [Polaromonas sp. CG_9.11]